MPPVIVAVAASAAFYATSTALTAALITTGIAAATTAGIIGVAYGTIAAIGVSYGLSAIRGLNGSQKRPTLGNTAEARKQLIRGSVEPRQVIYGTARVSGPMVYATSSGPNKEYLHLIIPLANHPVAGINAVWVNNIRVPASDIDGNGYVTAGYYGPRKADRTIFQPDEAPDPQAGFLLVKIYDGTQTSADPGLVADSTDGWGADHVLNGVAYAYVRLRYDREVYPNSLSDVSFEVRGKRTIFDPRNGQTYFTSNAAVILDYLRSEDGLRCSDDEIDYPSFATAANISAEAVQITEAGALQSRYDCDVAFKLDRAPIEVMDDMLTSCGGSLIYSGGKYRLYVSAYDVPTDTLGVSDLAGDVEVATRPSRRDLFNGIRGTFIDPASSWQATEFPAYSEGPLITEDGEEIWKDAEFPCTIDKVRAQRLAKLALRRARESLIIRAPVKYAGVRYAPWQMLAVTLEDFGWNAKPFRVQSWSFDPGNGIVTLTLREESAASYAWTFDDLGTEGTLPNTDLVDPFNIPAPAGLALTEELYATRDGAGVRTRAILTWAPPGFPFTRGYEVQYRATGTDAWQLGAQTLGETRAAIEDLAEGPYEWRVRANSGVASGAWATLAASIGGLAAVPPAQLTGLALQAIGGLAFLRWDLHPDLDVRAGGRIEFRHTPELGSPAWVGSTSIGDAVPGNQTFTILPLKAGTYLGKAVDAGGRYASEPAIIAASQATALAFANVDTLAEAPGFAGAKTDTILISSTLRLDTGGDIDSEPDFDAIAAMDALGGILPTGSYTFSGGIDLGAVGNVRLTTLIEALVVNTFDNVDTRPLSVDDWRDWDGAVGGEADAWVEVRTTQDNPGGTPTWDAWRRLDAAEFRARGFQFRAQLRSYDPAFNIHVSELTATADEVV